MIEKQKRYVHIICKDGISIKGFISVFGEQKTMELINNANEDFILVHDAEIVQQDDPRSFRLIAKSVEIKSSIVLNKSVINWITEL